MLRQCDTVYQLGDGHSKINHLLFMDDLKLYGRNNRELELLQLVDILNTQFKC